MFKFIHNEQSTIENLFDVYFRNIMVGSIIGYKDTFIIRGRPSSETYRSQEDAAKELSRWYINYFEGIEFDTLDKMEQYIIKNIDKNDLVIRKDRLANIGGVDLLRNFVVNNDFKMEERPFHFNVSKQ